MSEVADLVKRGVTSIKLRILVFGPAATNPSSAERVQALRQKRVDIRQALVDAGHVAVFPEDIVEPGLPPPVNNPVLQEMLLLKEYDYVVVLVESPGSNVELGMITSTKRFAEKSHLLIASEYGTGLARSACQLCETLGGAVSEFEYPRDITECHLLSKVLNRVATLQLARFLSPS